MLKIMRTGKWMAAILAFSLASVPLFAAPPSGGGGGNKVSVTAANPPDAFQGEELDVIVSGSGFDQGSQVSYLVTGTTDGSQVEVISVEFISSSELKTRVRPKDAALPSEYDIEVRTTSGRKGKGTTLFRVKSSVNLTSCAEKPSEFPAFAYTRNAPEGGNQSGFYVYLSNADGDCSVLLYSTTAYHRPESDLSYRQIGDAGIIAWRQSEDEQAGQTNGRSKKSNDPRDVDVIRVVRFHVAGKEVVSELPLQPDTVANSGGEFVFFLSMDLSSDGTRIALVRQDRINDAPPYRTFDTIREVDISSCSANCSQVLIHSHREIETFLNVAYNVPGNRIYFSGGVLGDSGDPLAGQAFISFLENQEGEWTGPRDLTVEGNGYYGTDFSAFAAFRVHDVNAVDLGWGLLAEAVAYTFNNVETGLFDVHVIDAGSCTVFGVDDCLGSGESSFEASIADAKYPSFNNGLSSSTLLFSADTTSEIYELDFQTLGLSVVAIGNEADTGN